MKINNLAFDQDGLIRTRQLGHPDQVLLHYLRYKLVIGLTRNT